jgi:TonB family protein
VTKKAGPRYRPIFREVLEAWRDSAIIEIEMRSSRERRRVASAWLISAFAHIGLLTAAGYGVARSLRAERAVVPWALDLPLVEHAVDIELPEVAVGTVASARTEAPEEARALERGGGEGTPRIDTGKPGRGGTDTAEKAATNLADRDEGLDLSREMMSRFDRSQIQRIRSARKRAAREDWRASREPMQLTFLASGDSGRRPERRTPARSDPSAGGRDRGMPARTGTALGGAEMPPGLGERRRDPGSPTEGAARASTGLGVRDGAAGFDHRESAKVALARPMVPEGTPSVPAEVRDKPRDNVDSEQEVSSAIQRLVHASTAGGVPGRGPGGQQGPGATGAGGPRGPGSTSRALGTGQGRDLDVDPRDKRRSDYIRKVVAKGYPLWSFPKWAAAEGLQGMAAVSFTIRADGSITPPIVTRPSNIAEFDESCRQAYARAAPYEPLPPELGPSYRLSVHCDAKNPAVLPKSAKASKEPSP